MAKQTKQDFVEELDFNADNKVKDSNRVYGVLDVILNEGEEFARESYGDDVVDKELIKMQNRRK